MPIDPVDVRAAIICAFSLPDEASPADLDAAVERLDGPGALDALRTIADLLSLQEGEVA